MQRNSTRLMRSTITTVIFTIDGITKTFRPLFGSQFPHSDSEFRLIHRYPSSSNFVNCRDEAWGICETLGCVALSPRTNLSLTFSFVLSPFETANGPGERFFGQPCTSQGPRSCAGIPFTNREEYTISGVRGVGNKLGPGTLPALVVHLSGRATRSGESKLRKCIAESPARLITHS
jgi:hypothetical protein